MYKGIPQYHPGPHPLKGLTEGRKGGSQDLNPQFPSINDYAIVTGNAVADV